MLHSSMKMIDAGPRILVSAVLNMGSLLVSEGGIARE
jgi:hypothetical protein